MDASSNGHPLCRCFTGFYAVVSYIPGPLGEFLDRMRGHLVSNCKLRSHVTLLPPRDLSGKPGVLIEEFNSRLHSVPSFDITLGDVEMFESTQVIYLSLRSGRARVEELHRELNQGALQSVEPFPFHPHLTLAQQIPGASVAETLQTARRMWSECPYSPTFTVHTLDFVQNVNPTLWETRSEYLLQPANLLRIA